MKSILMKAAVLCVSAASVFTVRAMLPASVSNEFWCTWGYVNPMPYEGAAEIGSEAVVRGYSVCAAGLAEAVVRGATWNFSQELMRFNSRPLRGLMLIVR